MEETCATYTLKQVIEKTKIPSSTIRRWEEDFHLEIKRDANNSRRFSKSDLDILSKIKLMRDEGVSKDKIGRLIVREPTEDKEVKETLSETRESAVEKEIHNIQLIFQKYPEIEQSIKNKVKNDILYQELKTDLKNDIVSSVRNEIATGFKEFSESYKSEVNRRDELLTENMRLKKELKKDKKPGIFRVFG